MPVLGLQEPDPNEDKTINLDNQVPDLPEPIFIGSSIESAGDPQKQDGQGKAKGKTKRKQAQASLSNSPLAKNCVKVGFHLDSLDTAYRNHDQEAWWGEGSE